MSGYFSVEDTEVWLELWAAALAAVRERGIQLGIAAERIDGLVRDLPGSEGRRIPWATSAFMLDLALRKPVAG